VHCASASGDDAATHIESGSRHEEDIHAAESEKKSNKHFDELILYTD
jgi:hypothetical protein